MILRCGRWMQSSVRRPRASGDDPAYFDNAAKDLVVDPARAGMIH